MAETPQNETVNFLYKIGIYAMSVALGLAAKLANKHKEQPVTIKEAILSGIITTAAAWGIWQWLAYVGKPDLGAVLGIVIGRYGDEIMKILWKSMKEAFIMASKIK